MASSPCELFGHFIYAPELSYNELYEREAELLETIQDALVNQGAQHIDFTQQGDSLRVQCVFAEFNEETSHAVCNALSPLLEQDVEGKLLFLDVNLASLAVYFLSNGICKESIIEIPSAHSCIDDAAADPTPIIRPD